MKVSPLRDYLLMAFVILFAACKDKPSLIPPMMPSAFNAYWYDGKAEISSYSFSQWMNGTKYEGKTVLLYVTEEFDKRKHIRVEPSNMKNSDAVQVMRLNSSTDFTTGISSTIKSSTVYTPVDRSSYPESLKFTFSQNDWNGQIFTEAKWKGNRYDVNQISYLLPGAEKKQTMARASLEDEIWTLIRIAPDMLPLGKVKFIASPAYLQYNKVENKVYDAETSLTSSCDYYNYSIYYPDLNRTLDIEFESKFPYKVISWSERVGDTEISSARILHTMKTDYWNRHGRIDEVLRKDLKLDEN